MIRKSFLVGCAALLLSLSLHGLGLTITTRDLDGATPPEGALDVADVGGAFEDFAEAVTPPDQPDVTEPVTAPTSQALVASDSPQYVTTPDTGEGEVTSPDGPGETAETPGVNEAEPIAQETPEEAPQEPPQERVEAQPVDVVEDDAAPEPVDSPAPDIVVAALPDEADIQAAEEVETEQSAAVTRSLRPPRERPTTEALTARKAPRAATGVIESPLAAYRRSGVDPLRGSGGGTTGFSGSRAGGNAGTTNYAGLVLTRLNRAPIVYASARGMARVSFQINPDGTLAWVRILSSSGSSDIERAAQAQVRRAAPFPPPPNGTSQRLVFNYRNR